MQDTFDPAIDGRFKGRKPLKLQVKRANRELNESLAELRSSEATPSEGNGEAAGDDATSPRRKVAWASVHGVQSIKEQAAATEVMTMSKGGLSVS